MPLVFESNQGRDHEMIGNTLRPLPPFTSKGNSPRANIGNAGCGGTDIGYPCTGCMHTSGSLQASFLNRVWTPVNEPLLIVPRISSVTVERDYFLLHTINLCIVPLIFQSLHTKVFNVHGSRCRSTRALRGKLPFRSSMISGKRSHVKLVYIILCRNGDFLPLPLISAF